MVGDVQVRVMGEVGYVPLGRWQRISGSLTTRVSRKTRVSSKGAFRKCNVIDPARNGADLHFSCGQVVACRVKRILSDPSPYVACASGLKPSPEFNSLSKLAGFRGPSMPKHFTVEQRRQAPRRRRPGGCRGGGACAPPLLLAMPPGKCGPRPSA